MKRGEYFQEDIDRAFHQVGVPQRPGEAGACRSAPPARSKASGQTPAILGSSACGATFPRAPKLFSSAIFVEMNPMQHLVREMNEKPNTSGAGHRAPEVTAQVSVQAHLASSMHFESAYRRATHPTTVHY